MAKPIIPWMGGKSRLLEPVLDKFPVHTCYVEAFAGAAAIFFRKPPSEIEAINDFNGDLSNLYRVVQNHLEEFVRQFKWAISSRQVFEWEKAKVPETLTDIQRAARFYYLQKQAFGGRCEGQSYGTATTTPPRLNILRIEEELTEAWRRLQGVYVENLSWEGLFKRYDRSHSFFYLDPPYWETAGYGIEFGFEHYETMANLAKSIEGAMLVSINDHPDIRKVFDGLHMEQIPIKYTVGGGENACDAFELLIWNDNCEEKRGSARTRDMFGGRQF